MEKEFNFEEMKKQFKTKEKVIKEIMVQKLKEGENILKKDFITKYKINERQFRYYMSELAYDLPIISLSHNRGYRLATNSDLTEIQIQLSEFRKRQDKLELRKKPLLEKLYEIKGVRK